MKLDQLLASLEKRKQAPTEHWNPPYCGELPLHIDAEGQWHYQNSPIKRLRLVKLFASVLVREGNDYFLVTPAEKVKITVADAPFVIVTWQQLEDVSPPTIQLTTNLDEEFALSSEHPLILDNGKLYVDCGRGMMAKVHRNVVYQWADIAHCKRQGDKEIWFIESAGQEFALNQ